MYFLKRKDQVFEQFQHGKALVEKSSGKKLKTLRTDNGGEYTSAEFERLGGARHECTVPMTPEQNGVAERMNRTPVESCDIHPLLHGHIQHTQMTDIWPLTSPCFHWGHSLDCLCGTPVSQVNSRGQHLYPELPW